MSKKLIVFIDSGDTLVNEGTEYRNEGSPIVQSCELIDGAKELLLTLKERGYTIELVADGYTQSFDNSYGQHGLKNIFDARTISEEVGEKKPSQAMFETAMKLLHLTDEDKKRIIMVGNNLERDIVGANRFGITSVFIKWSPRYPMEPKNEEEVPFPWQEELQNIKEEILCFPNNHSRIKHNVNVTVRVLNSYYVNFKM